MIRNCAESSFFRFYLVHISTDVAQDAGHFFLNAILAYVDSINNGYMEVLSKL